MTEPTTWLKKRELANYLSVTIRTIDYLIKNGKLPKPYGLTSRLKRWDLKEIDEHVRKYGDPREYEEKLEKELEKEKPSESVE